MTAIPENTFIDDAVIKWFKTRLSVQREISFTPLIKQPVPCRNDNRKARRQAEALERHK